MTIREKKPRNRAERLSTLVLIIAGGSIMARLARLFTTPDLLDVLAIVAGIALLVYGIHKFRLGQHKAAWQLIAVEAILSLFVVVRLDAPAAAAAAAAAAPGINRFVFVTQANVDFALARSDEDRSNALISRLTAEGDNDLVGAAVGDPRPFVAKGGCRDLEARYERDVAPTHLLSPFFARIRGACAASRGDLTAAAQLYGGDGHYTFLGAENAAQDGNASVSVALLRRSVRNPADHFALCGWYAMAVRYRRPGAKPLSARYEAASAPFFRLLTDTSLPEIRQTCGAS